MRNLNWKLISSKYVYKDNWCVVRADKCELPDKRIIEPYYVFEFPNWGNVVVVTEEEKILLVKQYRQALGAVTIELPGGIINDDETPEQAVIREVKEETGYEIREIEFLYDISPNPATNSNRAYFFLAKNAKLTAAPQFDVFEDVDVITFSKEEIKQLLYEHRMDHGVQLAALYEACIRLGWLTWV